ncbi:tetratricopeptide repeat protein [Streptomyces europaeiscabiei]|uniref:tetratricopeptide repeat protein n=1 Tax=Streptomyces europaeiscabiei TaxID=146819 RepID=UPI0029A766EA|nr:tetratricopeptide repeat protein [Streptomyces europaeiscabiei]MDX3866853.1 tetratricopeptide repeat protein [Streptomyces europaeiscabiei]MDX3873119.1 tetratricopeptide repeat protein [Streptomyces europaeiscabiei]
MADGRRRAPKAASIHQEIKASGSPHITQVAGDQLNVSLSFGDAGRTIVRALDMLPPPPARLIGREDMVRDLLLLLDPQAEQPSEASATAVIGMPGIGKSAFALHVAHEAVRRGWYPVALYVALHGYEPDDAVTPEQALNSLLRALGVSGAGDEMTFDERAGLYQRELGRLADENIHVLVVVDDASSADQVARLMPARKEHRIVITSRDCPGSLSVRIVDMPVLTPDASASFVTLALAHKRPGDPRASREPEAPAAVAAYCGHLPLALHIASALLADNPGLPISTLANDLAHTHTRLEELRHGRGELALAVETAFELSYRRLAPKAALVLRSLVLNPGPDLGTAAVAALMDFTDRQARKQLAELTSAGLLGEEPLGSGRWRMHDLIRAYTRGLAAQDESEAQQNAVYRLLRYYVAHVEDADGFVRALPGTHHPVLLRDRESALAWLDEERVNLVAVVETIAQGEPLDAEIAMAIAMALREYFLRFRYLDDAVRVMRRVVPLAERAGKRAEIAVLDCLGSALNALGRSTEAVPLHERVVSLGPGPGELATALNNLGNALLGDERPAEALEAYAQAVDLAAGTDDTAVEGMALTNTGRALLKLDRYTEAAAVLEEAVALRSASGDTYGEARAMEVLGAVLAHCGRGEEAIRLSADCAEFFADRGDALSQAISLSNLGIALFETGRTTEAIDTYKRAAELVEPLGEPAMERQVVSNLSNALLRTARWTEALDISSRAAIRAAAAGDLSAEGEALYFLGQAFNGAGLKGDAIEALTRSAKRCAACGDERGKGLALNVLGCVLAEEQRYAEAVEADQRAIVIFASRGELTDEIRVMGNLSEALEGEERFTEAIEVYAQTADLQAETGDLSGQQATLIVLIDALVRQERTAEAFGVRERVVEVSSALGDRETECDQLMCMGNLLESEERFHEAIHVYGRAVSIAMHHRLPDQKFAALNNLGLALIGTASHQAAVTALQEAAAATALPDRAIALDNLGVALQHLGRYDEAAGAHRHADALYRELGDTCGRGRAHNNLGLAFAHERRFSEAVAAHRKAESLHRTCGEREEEARAHNNGLAALTAWRNAASENERWAEDRA